MNLRYCFSYYRTQKSYKYWIIFQILVVFGLIIYSFFHHGRVSRKDLLITKVEFAITLIFLLEILIRIYLHRSDFFLNLANIADLTSLMLILVVFGFSYTLSVKHYHLKHCEDITMFVLALRYLIQIFRLCMELKKVEEIREAAKMSFKMDNEHEDPSFAISSLRNSVVYVH